MYSESAPVILFTHHDHNSRLIEPRIIQRYCGSVQKIVCTTIEEGLSIVSTNNPLPKKTIQLIFVEGNLGSSGQNITTLNTEDIDQLFSEFPKAHIHFYSGGTDKIEGLEFFLQKYPSKITLGVGQKLYGMKLIPENLIKQLKCSGNSEEAIYSSLTAIAPDGEEALNSSRNLSSIDYTLLDHNLEILVSEPEKKPDINSTQEEMPLLENLSLASTKPIIAKNNSEPVLNSTQVEVSLLENPPLVPTKPIIPPNDLDALWPALVKIKKTPPYSLLKFSFLNRNKVRPEEYETNSEESHPAFKN